jgi:hypothetical protein
MFYRRGSGPVLKVRDVDDNLKLEKRKDLSVSVVMNYSNIAGFLGYRLEQIISRCFQEKFLKNSVAFHPDLRGLKFEA